MISRAALTIMILFAYAISGTAQEVDVGHPVYALLERLESRGAFIRPLSASFPYTRERISTLLNEIKSSGYDLSAIEGRQLAWFMRQFDDGELQELSEGSETWHPFYRNHRDFYSLQRDDWAIYGNPVVLAEESFHRADQDSLEGELSIWGSGGEFHGRVRAFTFSAAATDQHVRGNTRLADPAMYPYRYGLQTEGFDFDEALASLGWESKHVTLAFGKTRNRWGPGRYDALTLSDRPTSYSQFRSRLRFGPLELISVQAKLRQFPPYVASSDTTADGIPRLHFADKYIAAHRLEWSLSKDFIVGLNESVVYGERGFDIDYLHPLLFLRSAEHYTGDRDNALLGADLKWRVVNGVLLYGEFLMDDVTMTKLGTGWFGNKFGFLTGFRTYDPFGLPRTRLVCEYSRIEPYVYSHKFAINSYQHYGTLIGASIGPNSDVLTASLAWTISRPLEIEGWGRFKRHGANPVSGRNVGGDVSRTWAPGDAKTVEFLDGSLIRRSSAGLRGTYEIFYNLVLTGAVQLEWSDVREELTSRTETEGSSVSFGFVWNRW